MKITTVSKVKEMSDYQQLATEQQNYFVYLFSTNHKGHALIDGQSVSKVYLDKNESKISLEVKKTNAATRCL